jgi:hypothetical protein
MLWSVNAKPTPDPVTQSATSRLVSAQIEDGAPSRASVPHAPLTAASVWHPYLRVQVGPRAHGLRESIGGEGQAIARLAAPATSETTAKWRAVLPDGRERSVDSVSQFARL